MKVPTVVIKSDNGPLIINESDFNSKIHKLWDGDKVVTEPVKHEVKAIHKGGGRWVVTVNGEHAHDGFLKKAEAKALAAEQ